MKNCKVNKISAYNFDKKHLCVYTAPSNFTYTHTYTYICKNI